LSLMSPDLLVDVVQWWLCGRRIESEMVGSSASGRSTKAHPAL
jgi:hypothetical protein